MAYLLEENRNPSRTKPAVKIMSYLYTHGPTTQTVLQSRAGSPYATTFRRTMNNLHTKKFIELNKDHKYTYTAKALREWPDVFDKLTPASQASSGQTQINAAAKFKSFEELREAVVAAPTPEEQVPGGIDLGIEAVEREMRERIEAEMRAKFRKAARAKVRLPFTIGGKTTTAYTIDEGLAACTAYMQACNDFLADI